MTLRRRLLLLFGVFLLLLAANAAQARVNLEDRNAALAEIRRMEDMRDLVARMLAAYVQQQGGLRSYVITGEERFLQLYESGRQDAREQHALLDELLGGDEALRRTAHRLVRAEERWHADIARPEIAAIQEGRDADSAMFESSGTGIERFSELLSEVEGIRVALQARQLAADFQLDAARRAIEALAVQTFVAGLVVLVLGAWGLRRWVTWPLEEIAVATRAVADGDLDHAIPAPGPPDVAALGRDAERMRERIVQQLGRVVRAREALTQHGPAVVALREELEPNEQQLPAGTTFAGLLKPGRGELAGDWYDALRLADHHVGVVVGDVSGQGAAAGVLAVRVKQLLIAALRDGRDPGEALEWVALHLGDTGERFVTAFVAKVNTTAWTCRWASAGHPPGLIAGEAGTWMLEATGPLLGPLPGTWPTMETTLLPGSVLVVCTDGVLEARDGRGHEFGTERWTDVVSAHRAGGPAAVVDACLDAASAFGRDGVEDDLTVVALARRPARGPGSSDQPSGVSSAQ